MSLLEILFSGFIILVLASLDAFALGFSYGSRRVQIPLKSVAIVSVICSFFLLFSLVLGYFLGEFIPFYVTKWLSFGIFLALGLSRILVWMLNRKKPRRELRAISLKELTFLALILSIDGIGIGTGVGLMDITIWFIVGVFVVSIFTEIFIFRLGQIAGGALAGRVVWDIGWIGGILLILVAIIGLFV